MNFVKLSLPLGICLLLAAAACGDDVETGPTSGSGGAASSSTGVGAQGGMGGCSPDGDLPGTTCVFSVRGSLIDEQGAGVSNMVTGVVGASVISPAPSEMSGFFSIEVGAFIALDKFAVNPHARDQNKAMFYYPLPAGDPGPIIDVGALLLLDMPTDGPTLVAQQDDMGAPEQSLTSNGVTLNVPEGIQIVPGFDDVFDGQAHFEARQVQAPHIDTFAAGHNLLALWSFYPFEAAFRPEGNSLGFAKASLTLPNPTNLPAGTAVELLSYGGFVYPEIVPAGSYQVVATATVSANGTIETDLGQGVQVLTWIGIRAAN